VDYCRSSLAPSVSIGKTATMSDMSDSNATSLYEMDIDQLGFL
jgi:hypothetical protein